MNLLNLRKWLVKESGRYELVTDTVSYGDNGANDYIRAGQMWLDDMQETRHADGTNMKLIASGTNSIVFGWCRSIREVWCIDQTTDYKWQLEKKVMYKDLTLEDKSIYPETETGAPLYYQPSNFRLAPEDEAIGDIDVPVKYMQFIGSSYLYNGIIVSPVPDMDYIIETKGLFYSPVLAADTDENFWSLLYPHLLIMSAQCIMEMFSRNTEGVKDWTQAIKLILTGIDHNMVDQDIYGVAQMNG